MAENQSAIVQPVNASDWEACTGAPPFLFSVEHHTKVRPVIAINWYVEVVRPVLWRVSPDRLGSTVSGQPAHGSLDAFTKAQHLHLTATIEAARQRIDAILRQEHHTQTGHLVNAVW